jgi:CHAT domain-containing protein/tetratricopeptide (TPR) repeat protein
VIADPREKAIEHFKAALETAERRSDSHLPATLHAKLGSAYAARRAGDPADNLEQALTHFSRSLALEPRSVSPREWASNHHNLGTTFVRRLLGDKAENIEAAIDHFRNALQVRSREADPSGWATTQFNLAAALSHRIRGDRARNLDRALRHNRRALSIYSPAATAQEWAVGACDLASILLYRIRGERSDNLERALDLHRQALQILSREANAEDWARAMSNLALVFASRTAGDPHSNLEEAVACCERALLVYTRDRRPVEWARVQVSLGLIRYQQEGDRAAYLARSRAHLESALEVFTRSRFPEMWAGTHFNLANTLTAVRTGHPVEHLEAAIAHYDRAQEIYGRDTYPERWAMIENNIGAAYGHLADAGRADAFGLAALHHGRALEIFDRHLYPDQHQRCQQSIGDLLSTQGRWRAAHAAYTAAIAAGEDLVAGTYTDVGRGDAAARSADVYASDAFCLVRMGCARRAFLQLDRGKTRQLAEALALSDLDATALPELLRRRLHDTRQTIRLLEWEARAPEGGARDAGTRANALRVARLSLRDTWKILQEDYPHLAPQDLQATDLHQLVPKGGALVAPLLTPRGGVAIVVTGVSRLEEDRMMIPLDDFASGDLLGLLLGGGHQFPEWRGWLGTYEQRQSDRGRWLGMIEAAGAILWARLMGPIHQRLVDLKLKPFSPVVLLLQGGLAAFPLHAAGQPGSLPAFLDSFTVSYAPSAQILSVCRRRAAEETRRSRSLVAVIDPTGSLTHAAAEGEVIKRFFPDVETLSKDATPVSLTRAATGKAFIHFAGHAQYAWNDPMKSALALANGSSLTVAEAIATFDLRASRLVTLSGCETGIVDTRRAPDEYLGLPTGFLQAGAPAVLSTLWEVDDRATWLLVERFYELHLQGGPETGGVPAPLDRALNLAQRWLRDVPAGVLATRFNRERRLPDHERTLPYDVVSAGWRRFAASPPEERPFFHPYYWAAFTLSGA